MAFPGYMDPARTVQTGFFPMEKLVFAFFGNIHANSGVAILRSWDIIEHESR